MLGLFNNRKFLAFSLWFIVGAFIVTIFLVWGVGSRQAAQNFVIKINDVPIKQQELTDSIENARTQLRDILGEDFQLSDPQLLEKTAMKNLVKRYLLLQEAEKLNIPVSDEEVLATITDIPSFQTNGQFDRQLYQQLLSRQRITPAEFESLLKTDILFSKMLMLQQHS